MKAEAGNWVSEEPNIMISQQHSEELGSSVPTLLTGDKDGSRISQRQGSSSSETGQQPVTVTLSAEAATDPNSKTDKSDERAARRTSIAPFMPGTSDDTDSGFGTDFSTGAFSFLLLLLPLLNQEKFPW
ncbi:unnamed protein product [Fraxinus pennsylvanica]|uniref:Uncharacterized protein n=1 Tax=Fraxinus pennsylvanica TaxID=56036 RepID=A0AAD1ZUS7_9LAMI|nr:unnamed protein product [Fraxinus pennsylvanica]